MTREELREFLVTSSLWPVGTLQNMGDLLVFLNADEEPDYGATKRWTLECVSAMPAHFLTLILEIICESVELPETYTDARGRWEWGLAEFLWAWGKRDLPRLLHEAAPALQNAYARPCLLKAICMDEGIGADPAWLPLFAPLVTQYSTLSADDKQLMLEALRAISLSTNDAMPLISRLPPPQPKVSQ